MTKDEGLNNLIESKIERKKIRKAKKRKFLSKIQVTKVNSPLKKSKVVNYRIKYKKIFIL